MDNGCTWPDAGAGDQHRVHRHTPFGSHIAHREEQQIHVFLRRQTDRSDPARQPSRQTAADLRRPAPDARPDGSQFHDLRTPDRPDPRGAQGPGRIAHDHRYGQRLPRTAVGRRRRHAGGRQYPRHRFRKQRQFHHRRSRRRCGAQLHLLGLHLQESLGARLAEQSRGIPRRRCREDGGRRSSRLRHPEEGQSDGSHHHGGRHAACKPFGAVRSPHASRCGSGSDDLDLVGPSGQLGRPEHPRYHLDQRRFAARADRRRRGRPDETQPQRRGLDLGDQGCLGRRHLRRTRGLRRRTGDYQGGRRFGQNPRVVQRTLGVEFPHHLDRLRDPRLLFGVRQRPVLACRCRYQLHQLYRAGHDGIMGPPQRQGRKSRTSVGEDRPARRPRHICLLRQLRLVPLPVQGRASQHEPQRLAVGRQLEGEVHAFGQLLQRRGTLPSGPRPLAADQLPFENFVRHQQVAKNQQ